MKLTRLLLLAGVAYGINAFLKTPKGKTIKNDLMHRMDGWKKEVENLASKKTSKNPITGPAVENNITSAY